MMKTTDNCSHVSMQATNATAVAVAGHAKLLANPVCLSVPVQRIAVFHPNGLDDLLFALPALLALRESFPGATITSVLRQSLASLLRETRLVDEIIHRPKGGLSAQASLMARLHAARYDMALVFSQSRNMTLLAWSTGAPIRAGFDGAKMEALLTHRAPKSGVSRLDWHLDLVREIGCKTPQLDYGGLLEIGAPSIANARQLLEQGSIAAPFVLVAPSSGSKRSTPYLSQELWRQSVCELSARWPVVLAGASANEWHFAGESGAVFDVCGQTDLPTLAALCGQATCVVAVEGGLVHLGAAMRTPVVALANAGEWKSTLPRGVAQRILSDENAPDAEQIVQATHELIGV